MKTWQLTSSLLAVIAAASLFAFGDAPSSSATTNSTTEVRPPAFESLVPMPRAEQGPTLVYKWQDADGTWHYGDAAPAGIAPETVILVSPGSDASNPGKLGLTVERATQDRTLPET